MSSFVILGGAFHEGILPVPFEVRPILVFELVQAKVALLGILIKFPILICSPGQTEILGIWSIVGIGKIVTVKLIGVPTHEYTEDGVTTIFPVILLPVVLAGAIHIGILPVPLAAIPMSVLELVHVKEEPGGLLTKSPMSINVPEHSKISDF